MLSTSSPNGSDGGRQQRQQDEQRLHQPHSDAAPPPSPPPPSPLPPPASTKTAAALEEARRSLRISLSAHGGGAQQQLDSINDCRPPSPSTWTQQQHQVQPSSASSSSHANHPPPPLPRRPRSPTSPTASASSVRSTSSHLSTTDARSSDPTGSSVRDNSNDGNCEEKKSTDGGGIGAGGRRNGSDINNSRGGGSGGVVSGSFRSERSRSSSSSQQRSSLTRTERTFLESLLSDPTAHPDRVRMASDRLSDSSLFPVPPPGDGDGGGNDDGGNASSSSDGGGGRGAGAGAGTGHGEKKKEEEKKKTKRDSTVQRELFRAHERTGVPPSLVLRRLSDLHGGRKAPRPPPMPPKTGGDAAAVAGAVGSVASAPAVESSIPAPSGAGEVAGGGSGRGRRDVVFLASRTSQGFEVEERCPAEEEEDGNDARVGGLDLAMAEKKKKRRRRTAKKNRQIKFQMAEGDGLSRLSLGDKNGSNGGEDDGRTDGEVRPTSPDDVAEQHVEDDIQSWELDSDEDDDEDEGGYDVDDDGDGDGDDDGDAGGEGPSHRPAVDTLGKKGDIYHHQPDAWDVFRDEYAWGYGYSNEGRLDVAVDDGGGDGGDVDGDGGGGERGGVDPSAAFRNATTSASSLPFKILGTHADDVACHPHVLSPPLMESLQSFMPESLTARHNFWLKHSLQRDGPSLYGLLQNVRGSVRTVLAVETTTGHVFGSFTSAPWRTHWGYYGSDESFVWRMRRSRLTPCHSVVEQAVLESELEVYPYTGSNDSVQLCRMDKIGIGGGEIEPSGDDACGCGVGGGVISWEDEAGGEHFGNAISLSSDLTYGTTSTCETFGSPCLTNLGARGEEFEVANLEVWTMTPCDTVKEAERDEMTRLFFEEETSSKKLNVFGILMGSP